MGGGLGNRSLIDQTMQEASFSVLRNLPPGHLMAYLDQLRDNGSAAGGEGDHLSMAQRDFFEQLGRTKRQMYKRWTTDSKRGPQLILRSAVLHAALP